MRPSLAWSGYSFNGEWFVVQQLLINFQLPSWEVEVGNTAAQKIMTISRKSCNFEIASAVAEINTNSNI